MRETNLERLRADLATICAGFFPMDGMPGAKIEYPTTPAMVAEYFTGLVINQFKRWEGALLVVDAVRKRLGRPLLSDLMKAELICSCQDMGEEYQGQDLEDRLAKLCGEYVDVGE